MKLTACAAAAVLLALGTPTWVAGQTGAPRSDVQPLGSSLPADAIRDLPVGDNVYAILENTQPELISDRFNSGGLNVGGDSRVGGFLGSWSQTLFRVGDLDVSDPSGSGSMLLFPDATFWRNVSVHTGLMPADVNTPGLAVILDPMRGATAWTRTFSGSGSGGSLSAGAPTGEPPPIARLSDFAQGSAVVSGPLSSRASLVAAGRVAYGSSYRREQLATTSDTNASVFAHLVFAASPVREWRALAWVQHTATPFEYWQPFQAPSASTGDTAVHLQSTLEHHPADGAQWRVFGGFTQRARTNDATSSTILLERITVGPVVNTVDAAADTTGRRLAVGGRLTPYRAPDARQRFEFGADIDAASTKTSGMFAGTVRESVNAVPARIWTYPANSLVSHRGATSFSAYASDVITLAPALILDASLRAELVHGGADAAATSITWFTLLPHAYLRLAVTDKSGLVLGYARSANTLSQTWLAYGDPAGQIATVASAAAPSVLVSRVGPGTGGNNAFSQIDENLKRPYTDELVVGFERRHNAAGRFTFMGVFRREANRLGIVNTGVPASSYSTISVPDQGQDWDGSTDDRLLTGYNRLPSSFGKDTYLLTNPTEETARAYALRTSWEHTGERLFMVFGATASAAEGSGGNRGYGPLENDQDVPGELFSNPNAATYSSGRLFADRAFTIKWTTLYRFPGEVTVGGIARYQDGQPFSRLAVVPGLNQGTEGVQAYPNAGTRFTFTSSLDLRAQKGFRAGRSHIDVILDAYNLLTLNNEVEEYVVAGPNFRSSTAIEPPHSVHLGLRVSF